MPITVTERWGSRDSQTGRSRRVTLTYLVAGTDSDLAAKAAVLAQAPPSYDGIPRGTASITQIAEQYWEAEVSYEPADVDETGAGGGGGGEPTNVSFSFDTTGATTKVTQSLRTVASTSRSLGEDPPADLKGAINVTDSGVDGVDIIIPQFNMTAAWVKAPEEMSAEYVAALYNLTGKVNDEAFSFNVDGTVLTFQEGELLFAGCSGVKKLGSGNWEITGQFAASPNKTDIQIADLAPIASKKGWEYLWIRYADSEDADAKDVVKRPVAAYVEQVYETASFAFLHGGEG